MHPAEVLFAEITVSQGNLDGELYDNTLTDKPPSLSQDSEQDSLTGTDNAGRLTLYDDGGTIFGSVSERSLTLAIPQTNGVLMNVIFHRASVSAYNRALSQRQQHVSAADAAVNKVDNDLAVISSPEGTLGDDQVIANDEAYHLDSDLYTVRMDEKGVTEDNSGITAGEVPGESYCIDTNTNAVYNDAHKTYSTAQSMVADAKLHLGADLREVQKVIRSAPADWAAYWRAQKALASYRFGSIPPLKIVLAVGEHLINDTVAQVNSDIYKANTDVAKAYIIVNALSKAYHCWPSQTAPTVRYVTAQWLEQIQ